MSSCKSSVEVEDEEAKENHCNTSVHIWALVSERELSGLPLQ